jgi:hypothetical protein
MHSIKRQTALNDDQNVYNLKSPIHPKSSYQKMDAFFAAMQFCL